jgi:CBS-domain-containing membrane protein
MQLPACTAEELMHPEVKSIGEDSTVREALDLMIQESLRAAPVVDDTGRPVGVVSSTDILIHDQEGERPSGKSADPTLVRDIMTPAVFSVGVGASVVEVIEHLKALKVHHLFVVDEGGMLVGVITPMDVLNRLEPA